MHEHIFKIVGAFDALTATFAATMMPRFQPWSAIVPNLLGAAVILGFFIAGRRVGKPVKEGKLRRRSAKNHPKVPLYAT